MLGQVDLPMADYQTGEGVSRSELVRVLRSPAHYLWAKMRPEPPTPAQRFGTATHVRLFEPGRWDELVTVRPTGLDLRKKADKAAFVDALGLDPADAPTKVEDIEAEFYRRHPERVLLAAADAATIDEMGQAVRAHPGAAALLAEGAAEQTFFWTDPDTGELCKVRPDWITGRVLVDLKTTTDARPESFAHESLRWQYHVQAAFYLDGVNAAAGEVAVDAFVIIALEKDPPYGIWLHNMEPDQLELGRREYRRALNIYHQCREHDEWPGYPDTIEPLNLPTWKQREIGWI